MFCPHRDLDKNKEPCYSCDDTKKYDDKLNEGYPHCYFRFHLERNMQKVKRKKADLSKSKSTYLKEVKKKRDKWDSQAKGFGYGNHLEAIWKLKKRGFKDREISEMLKMSFCTLRNKFTKLNRNGGYHE
jgi:hypothetical protein